MTLTCTKIRNLDDPEKCLAMTFENEYYRFRIHYLKPDYQKHKRKHDFDPIDVHVTVAKKHNHFMQLFVCAENKQIGIQTDPESEILFSDEDIKQCIEIMTATYETGKLLKDILKEYFEIEF